MTIGRKTDYWAEKQLLGGKNNYRAEKHCGRKKIITGRKIIIVGRKNIKRAEKICISMCEPQ